MWDLGESMKTVVKEKPILFKTEMVKAILDNRKTVTRRIIKHTDGTLPQSREAITHSTVRQKYFQGDVLWVRENYQERKIIHHRKNGDEIETGVIFKADMKYWADKEKWKSPLYMPRKYTRIFLKVTDLRVERLQYISEAEIRKEGIEDPFFDLLWDGLHKNKPGCKWEDNPYVWVIEFERLLDYE